MLDTHLRVALVGGIYGKPPEYRSRFQVTPETTLESGLKSQGVEVFTFSHQEKIAGRYDIIHVHHLSWGAVRASLAPCSSAFVFTPHNPRAMAGTLDWYRRAAMSFTIRRADALISLSAAEGQFYNENYEAEDAAQAVIPNGFNGSQYTMQRTNRAGRDAPWQILYIGQLAPLKRVDLLLRAVAQLPFRAVLKLVYQNPEQEINLTILAQQLGIGTRVQFLGMKNPSELHALYNDADLFVLPSSGEALPSVVTEAMMTGTPLVATDTGGVRSQVGGFGQVVPPNDLHSLTFAIHEVLSRYAEFQQRAPEMSRYAHRKFADTTMIEKHLEVYGKLACQVRRRRHRLAVRPMNLLLQCAWRS